MYNTTDTWLIGWKKDQIIIYYKFFEVLKGLKLTSVIVNTCNTFMYLFSDITLMVKKKRISKNLFLWLQNEQNDQRFFLDLMNCQIIYLQPF